MVVSQSPREQRCPVQSVVNSSLNFVGNSFIRPPPLTFQVALINMEWLVEVAHHGLISYAYFSLLFLNKNVIKTVESFKNTVNYKKLKLPVSSLPIK